MLPFDQKPWAKTVAGTVIVLSLIGAIAAVLYFRSIASLHISEVVGIFLLLLTIVPPNAAIVMRKPESESLDAHSGLARSTTVHPR